jgi:hypothetical protein
MSAIVLGTLGMGLAYSHTGMETRFQLLQHPGYAQNRVNERESLWVLKRNQSSNFCEFQHLLRTKIQQLTNKFDVEISLERVFQHPQALSLIDRLTSGAERAGRLRFISRSR